MTPKHLLIFLIANCSVNNASGSCYALCLLGETQVEVLNSTVQSSHDGFTHSSATSSSQYANVNPLNDLPSCRTKLVTLFSNYLFDIDIVMHKGVYVKHVLRKDNFENSDKILPTIQIHHASHVWV